MVGGYDLVSPSVKASRSDKAVVKHWHDSCESGLGGGLDGSVI